MICQRNRVTGFAVEVPKDNFAGRERENARSKIRSTHQYSTIAPNLKNTLRSDTQNRFATISARTRGADAYYHVDQTALCGRTHDRDKTKEANFNPPTGG